MQTRTEDVDINNATQATIDETCRLAADPATTLEQIQSLLEAAPLDIINGHDSSHDKMRPIECAARTGNIVVFKYLYETKRAAIFSLDYHFNLIHHASQPQSSVAIRTYIFENELWRFFLDGTNEHHSMIWYAPIQVAEEYMDEALLKIEFCDQDRTAWQMLKDYVLLRSQFHPDDSLASYLDKKTDDPDELKIAAKPPLSISHYTPKPLLSDRKKFAGLLDAVVEEDPEDKETLADNELRLQAFRLHSDATKIFLAKKPDAYQKTYQLCLDTLNKIRRKTLEDVRTYVLNCMIYSQSYQVQADFFLKNADSQLGNDVWEADQSYQQAHDYLLHALALLTQFPDDVRAIIPFTEDPTCIDQAILGIANASAELDTKRNFAHDIIQSALDGYSNLEDEKPIRQKQRPNPAKEVKEAKEREEKIPAPFNQHSFYHSLFSPANHHPSQRLPGSKQEDLELSQLHHR